MTIKYRLVGVEFNSHMNLTGEEVEVNQKMEQPEDLLRANLLTIPKALQFLSSMVGIHSGN